MNKALNWIIGFIVILAFMLGIVFNFQKPITLWLTGIHQHKYSIKKIPTDTMSKNKKLEGNFDTAHVNNVNFVDVVKAQLQNQNYPVIGAIAYPDVGINLPIFNGDGYNIMLFGAGTMKAGQEMGKGNFALASHHVSNVMGPGYSSLLFSPLTKSKLGQQIFLTDKEKVYDYTVDKVTVISEDQGQVILDSPGKKILTLITCDTSNGEGTSERILVQATLKRVSDFNNKTAEVFNTEYNQYEK